MKIAVLNGSPKGDYSVTLQTVLFWQKKFPEIEFEILNVGAKIKALEKDFSEAAKVLQSADAFLFSYPVYTFIAPCQLHRFFELWKENGIKVKGKFATQLSTSMHFYDVTAHRYVMENCQDLGLKYVKGLSANMDDLTKESGQKEAEQFFRYFLWCVQQDKYERVPVTADLKPLVVTTVPVKNSVGEKFECTDAENRNGDVAFNICSKKVVIVTDCEPENKALNDMISRFCKVFKGLTEVVNIREYPLKGGCISCFNCATDGKCIYKDGFDEYLRNNIQTGDAIVYAFTIKDHSMGARFKMYDDRQFCNGHRTVTMGMPFGYLVNGHYSREENLRMIIEGRAEVGHNFLAGVATNEYNPNREIDELAATLEYALEHSYVQPQNFLGVGGMKIFRDLIYMMRGMMRADHKFYKKHKQYDFPQKKKGTIMGMYLVGMMLSNKKIKTKMGNKMNEGMLMPYKKVLDKLEKEEGKK